MTCKEVGILAGYLCAHGLKKVLVVEGEIVIDEALMDDLCYT